MSSYRALCMQVRCHAVNAARDRAEARAIMEKSLDRLREQAAAAVAWVGRDDCRLVVFPEYFLTGFPISDSIPAWADKAALQMNGPEYEALGKMAGELSAHVAGSATRGRASILRIRCSKPCPSGNTSWRRSARPSRSSWPRGSSRKSDGL